MQVKVFIFFFKKKKDGIFLKAGFVEYEQTHRNSMPILL